MDWGKFVYLLFIVLLGYSPYKFIQRIQKYGLRNISTTTAILLSAWFVVLTIILFLQSSHANINRSLPMVMILGSTTLVWFFAPWLIPKIGVFPKQVVDEKLNRFLIIFQPRTFYLKYLEVLFQQVIYLFMSYVVLWALPYNSQVFWFTMIIGFFHLGNLFFLRKRDTMVFFVLSFPMAILFSFMILNGLLLITTSIHLWFYLVFAGYPWFQKNYKR